MNATTTIGEYKGHPTITIQFDTKRGPQQLTMGVAKAKAVLAVLDSLEEFVTRFDIQTKSTDGSDVT